MKSGIISIFLVAFVSLLTMHNGMAQVSISASNASPDDSAILDIQSTTKGLLIPRLSSQQRTDISAAATGLVVFDTTTESFWFKDANIWIELRADAISTISDLNGDTKIQTEANSNENIIRFDVEGTEISNFSKNENDDFLLQTSTNNVSLGKNAGVANIDGEFNTSLGFEAGKASTEGVQNTYVGNNTGKAVVSSVSNTMIGSNAGRRSKGSANTFIGRLAGGFNSTGSNNTMIGRNAGVNVLDISGNNGSGNVFISPSAGGLYTGNNRLYIAAISPFTD